MPLQRSLPSHLRAPFRLCFSEGGTLLFCVPASPIAVCSFL
ncbi:hypothetical protein BRYFOR_05651 [Marvinbryantia formatexigens DSM 14469]|uniref:Uncharacterized protein n=1 Tax=Marvinbryantia formatexigens DSM 14469 TaxID=478749 RepID=C6LAL0_9FIRM|nr:hypothetical protein BRYFOR_05651 [Marvinbryantia formatexigens DSM 14469]